jgi:hypothetical protein
MEDGQVSISGTAGRSRLHTSIPPDLYEEAFGSSSFMHGGPYDAIDLLTAIAHKLEVEVSEHAIIRAIDCLVNSHSEQVVIVANLMRSLEGMRAGREAAESMVAQQAQEIEDIEVQLTECAKQSVRGGI